MTNITKLKLIDSLPKVADCSVTYVTLALAWYTEKNEEGKAKALVRLLLRSPLDGRRIEITEAEKKLLQDADPLGIST